MLNVSKMSLFDICIRETVNLLKANYWPIGLHDFENCNPFAALPTNVNEKLVCSMVENTHSGTLSITDLYPMLISGRITNFELDSILISHEALISILTTLSVQGLVLKTLVLNRVSYIPSPYFSQEQVSNSVAAAIESLLALVPNLKSLKIGIRFNLEAIQKIPTLKLLEINFVPQNSLCDIIPRFNDDIVIPNDTLVHLSVIKAPNYIIEPEEIAFIIQYCPELKCFDNNICGGLELLHAFELFEGTLAKQYKFEKIILGDSYNVPQESAVATVTILHIVSVTCPNLKEIGVLVNDSNAIAVLRDLKTLECLLIQWEQITYAEDFRLGVKLVLEEIGMKLTDLTLIYFSNVDFGTIGRLCPNLKCLKVEYETELPSEEIPNFEHLEYLHLECNNGRAVTRHTLLQMLSSSKSISNLFLDGVSCLDDNTLIQVLTVNSLPKLNEAHLIDCSLGEDGLRSLVMSCPSLDILEISSVQTINFEITAQIVHSINPMVIVIFRDL